MVFLFSISPCLFYLFLSTPSLSTFSSPFLSPSGSISASYARMCWELLGHTVTAKLLNCHWKCSGLGWRTVAKCKSLIVFLLAIKKRKGFMSPMAFCSIPADLRSVVYPAAIAHGSEEEWDFLWQVYLNTTSPDEQSNCLSALAKATEPWILARSV